MHQNNTTYYKYELGNQKSGVFAVDLPYPDDEKHVDEYVDLLAQIGYEISLREHCLVEVGGRPVTPEFNDYQDVDVSHRAESLRVYFSRDDENRAWPLALFETFTARRIKPH